MKNIELGDTGAAVEDVQARLAKANCLDEALVTGVFGAETAEAVERFCRKCGIRRRTYIDDETWRELVDASYSMGDRTLYLRMPHFRGRDVMELQRALGALGFACGEIDGVFGVYTELALRKFQTNLGLPNEGICGAYTFAALKRLHHSWEGKEVVSSGAYLGFARAADVLERHAICLFGTDEFTRSVASRMSNLSLATNPSSKILSAESLNVVPDESMLLVRVVLPEESAGGSGAADGDAPGAPGAAGACAPAAGDESRAPRVVYDEEHDTVLARRMETAIRMATLETRARVTVELPGEVWWDAGAGRSAQHFAITLLDALCSALASIEENE